MQAHVTIIFNAHRSQETTVHAPPDAALAVAARHWFDQRWESLGCEPLRVSGKVLLLDKILGVADALGYSAFQSSAGLADEFAEQAVRALGSACVTVDLPGQKVAY